MIFFNVEVCLVQFVFILLPLEWQKNIFHLCLLLLAVSTVYPSPLPNYFNCTFITFNCFSCSLSNYFSCTLSYNLVFRCYSWLSVWIRYISDESITCYSTIFPRALWEREKCGGHQQFFAIVQLVGTPGQTENFAYLLELHRRLLTWEATPRSIHEGIATAIMSSDTA